MRLNAAFVASAVVADPSFRACLRQQVERGISVPGMADTLLFLFLRPPQLRQFLAKPRQRQSHNVEVATVNSWYESPAKPLNRVCAGLVEWLSRRKILHDLFSRNRSKVNLGGLNKFPPFHIRQSNQRHASEHRMGSTRKFFQHLPRILRSPWLAKNRSFQ